MNDTTTVSAIRKIIRLKIDPVLMLASIIALVETKEDSCCGLNANHTYLVDECQ
jgi:hypothetical protein